MLRNCVECGELFVSSGNPRCRDCLRSIADDLQRIRAYLRQEPEAGIDSIASATGTTRQRIMQFIQQGRLTLKKDVASGSRCAICGADIQLGRLCGRCQATLGKKTTQPRSQKRPSKSSAKGEGQTSLYALRRRRGH